MSGLAIKVVGLNEFRRGLKGIEAGLPKTMRVTLNSVAELFVGWVRPKIPKRTGRAAASLKPQSTQTQARIAAGGPKAPYYPWLDFGGTVGRGRKAAVRTGRGNRRTADQQARAGSVKRQWFPDGRYIFPTLVERQPDVESVMLKGLAQLASANGVEVS